MIPPLAFHHLGVACRDLDREEKTYQGLGYQRETDDFVDPIQGVRGRFLVGPGPRIELLQQLDGRDVLEPWLQHGSRIYHQAFEVDDITAAVNMFLTNGNRVVVEPVPAVAFEGRRIAFLMTRTMTLFELIEREQTT